MENIMWEETINKKVFNFTHDTCNTSRWQDQILTAVHNKRSVHLWRLV